MDTSGRTILDPTAGGGAQTAKQMFGKVGGGSWRADRKAVEAAAASKDVPAFGFLVTILQKAEVLQGLIKR